MSEKPYKVIIPGINGGGAQVFEAESPEEMQQQFQQAQENATAKIRELAAQNQALQEEMQKNQPAAQATNGGPDGFDKQRYFALLYENPVEAQKYAMSFAIGMPIEDFVKDYQQVRQGANLGIQNAVNAQFAQKHPELLQVGQEDDIHNATEISKILTENGWNYTINNLEAAYAVAKTNNKLKLPNINMAPEAELRPVPTTVSRPTGAGNMSEAAEMEWLSDPKTPLPKVKEYLERKYPGGRA